jgi:hypothetical protein
MRSAIEPSIYRRIFTFNILGWLRSLKFIIYGYKCPTDTVGRVRKKKHLHPTPHLGHSIWNKQPVFMTNEHPLATTPIVISRWVFILNIKPQKTTMFPSMIDQEEQREPMHLTSFSLLHKHLPVYLYTVSWHAHSVAHLGRIRGRPRSPDQQISTLSLSNNGASGWATWGSGLKAPGVLFLFSCCYWSFVLSKQVLYHLSHSTSCPDVLLPLIKASFFSQ